MKYIIAVKRIVLYHELNNYYPNTNLTIEINPKKFLDTQVITKNGKIKTSVYKEEPDTSCHGHQIHLSDINET